MEKEKTELTLEEMFEQLDGLLAKMQEPGGSLEETFARYKQGVELVEKCNRKIEKIECDIKLINSGENENE